MCLDEANHPACCSRRNFLLLAGSSLALAGCYREAPPAPPATQPTTHPKNPAPDLGSEMFPDHLGRPIAKASDAPVIMIPRHLWTRQKPNLAEMFVMNGVDKITVHHSAATRLLETATWKDTVGEVEGIREFHTGKDRDWADIAYHYVIDQLGRVWQGRPLVYQGAHAKLHNDHNLGICLMGNFDLQTPSAAQLVALATFVPFLRDLYPVKLSAIFTHGELVKTGCPGKALQAFMNRTRTAWAQP